MPSGKEQVSHPHIEEYVRRQNELDIPKPSLANSGKAKIGLGKSRREKTQKTQKKKGQYPMTGTVRAGEL